MAAAKGVMHAVCYDGYGRELKHVEVPVPSPKKDEILLKVEAASINPIDWKLRDGLFWPFLPTKFPFVPGSDVSGEIVEVGPGVTSFQIGNKVVCKLNSLKGGALAEYVIATVDLAVHRPPNVSPAEGAALPVAAGTALQALKRVGTKFDGTSKPANVLITAASGGVGHYAVQLAKLGNHHVTATSGARNMELVKSLGADEVLDYKTPEGGSLMSPSGKKYDFIIDCTHGLSWSVLERNLSNNGTVIYITPNYGIYLHSAVKRLTYSKRQVVPFMLKLQGDELEFLVELAREGKLKTVIDSRHHLSKAEEAWDCSIRGHATGKIIVEM